MCSTNKNRIVIGNVNCELREVFTKLAKLQTKQNFSFAIIAGDLFGDCTTEKELDEVSALLQESIVVPLPTYFGLGSRPLPTRVIERIEAKDEVCSNLYFLGKRGTLKTSEGIRLVSLGGTLESGKQSNRFHPGYTDADVRALYGTHNADILITHQWPKGIRTGSKVQVPDGVTTTEETQPLADLCSTLKPRYHISTSDIFYEREPFFHMPNEEEPDAKPLTRFLSLASYNNPSKQKWMYAFSLDPKAPYPLTVPTGATASPLGPVQTKRKGLPSQRESYHRFAGPEEHEQRPRKRARGPPPGPQECFFCLSNPNIATHLITSIGNECYLTTAKGPLPSAKTFPELGFPSHILIIPFTHTPTLNTITDKEARLSTCTEMQRYRTSLHSMLKQRANNKLGAVTFEVSRGNGIHIHWQFVPIASDTISRGLVEAAFKVEAENLSYPKFEPPSEAAREDPSAEPGDFFRVWIWAPSEEEQKEDAKTEEKCIILPLTPDFRFDLQFGRRVMAKLMGLEKRIHWKDAVQSQTEEEADANAFKEAFKEFDFSLE